MSYIPYKINLTNGANSSLIETNSSDLLTITENNIKLAGLVNINDLYKLPNASPAANGNYLLNSSSNVLSFAAYSPVSISQFHYNYYVSTSGDDANPGTQASPYKTIGACMTYINTLGADVNVSINLSSGTYNEAVLINKSGISIIGTSSTGCIITGDIGVNMTQNSSFYSIAEISNVQIVGQVSQLNANVYTNSLVLSNVVIAPTAGFNAISINSTGGGFLADCTIKNSSVIYANNDTIAILLTNGAITMIGSQITNNPTLANTIESFIKANGSSRVNLFGSSLIQNSNSASVKALIEIANTSNATSSSTINNCILTYTASTAAALGACMNFSNSASANTYYFYLNYCKCNYSVGIGGQNYIVGKTSTGAVNFTFGNNLGNTANHTVPNTGFTTGWTRTLMNAVI